MQDRSGLRPLLASHVERWPARQQPLTVCIVYAYCAVGIEFDPEKASANLWKHKVSFAHAEQALRDDQAITVEDPDAEGERRYITLGMDALGRVLVVVHTPRGRNIRLISARRASPGEARQYHA